MAETETFKLNKDFRRLYGKGKSLVFPSVVVYYKKNQIGKCRYGITVSKKIGGAVKRNRAKRVIRAAFREIYPKLNGGYDFVFVARVRTTTVKSTVLLNQIKKGLMQNGVIKPDEKNTSVPD